MSKIYDPKTGNLIEEDNSMYLYVILGVLFFMALSGGGWYYNTNYSDTAILAKSASASATSANNSAQTAVNAAAGANSSAADKAAADAVIAAAKATAAAAETKKAADDAKKATDDAKKSADDAKAALAKTLEACKTKLNIFTGTDGKKYICPPMYSFGNQNKNKYEDKFTIAAKNENKCWIVDGARKDCDWGANSCNPSTYTTPNGKKIVKNRAYWGKPEADYVGNYVNDGPAWGLPDSAIFYINKPMEYSDAEYCPA
jgi:hypothetical protein